MSIKSANQYFEEKYSISRIEGWTPTPEQVEEYAAYVAKEFAKYLNENVGVQFIVFDEKEQDEIYQQFLNDKK